LAFGVGATVEFPLPILPDISGRSSLLHLLAGTGGPENGECETTNGREKEHSEGGCGCEEETDDCSFAEGDSNGVGETGG
jgi:hypothetical protein